DGAFSADRLQSTQVTKSETVAARNSAKPTCKVSSRHSGQRPDRSDGAFSADRLQSTQVTKSEAVAARNSTKPTCRVSSRRSGQRPANKDPRPGTSDQRPDRSDGAFSADRPQSTHVTKKGGGRRAKQRHITLQGQQLT
ncbi:MAG: hypothetical protein AAF677_11000, partial [Pseudomonadota bacterium]